MQEDAKLVCNLCGTSFEHEDDGEGCTQLHHTFGYGSDWDGVSVALNVCGSCVRRLAVSSVYAPYIKDNFDYYTNSTPEKIISQWRDEITNELLDSLNEFAKEMGLMNQNNNLKKDIELLTGKYEEMKTRADKADVKIKRLREALEKVNSMLDMLDLDWELGAYVDDIQTLIRDELNKE